MIGIDPFDLASPAQSLQPANMGTHISLGVLALLFEVVTDALEVPARPVDAVVFSRIGRDVAVSRSWTGDDWGRFDDHVPSDLLDPARVLELDVMDPAIDAVDDEVDPLIHLVPGEAFGQNPTHNLFPGALAVKGELANASLLGEAVGGKRAVVDLMTSERAPSPCRVCSARSETCHRPGSSSVARPYRSRCLTRPIIRLRFSRTSQVAPSPGRRSITPCSCCSLSSICRAGSAALLRPHSAALSEALVTQFPGDQLACSIADTVADIVAGNVEDAAVIKHAPDDDVGVRMASVVIAV